MENIEHRKRMNLIRFVVLVILIMFPYSIFVYWVQNLTMTIILTTCFGLPLSLYVDKTRICQTK
jgi:hypothetical protein